MGSKLAVTLQLVAVSDPREKQRIEEYVARTEYALTTCYTRAPEPKRTPMTVNVRFGIDRTGRVTRARARARNSGPGRGTSHGKAARAEIADCVHRTISTIQFRKPAAPVRVHYDMVFRDRSALGKYGFGLSGSRRVRSTMSGGPIGKVPYQTLGHRHIRTRRNTHFGRPSPRPFAQLIRVISRGPLDQLIIRRYLQRYNWRFRSCYAKAVDKQPALRGVVSASFTIAPAGNAIGARASGVSKAVAACVTTQIGQIQFPKPRGGLVAVRLTLRFKKL